MMRRTVFSRNLMLSCGAATLAAILLLTFQATRLHRQFLQEQIDHRLQNVVSLLGSMFDESWPQESNHHLQSRIRDLGRLTHLRLTLIDIDGTVLADSEKETVREVVGMENHRNRVELVRALETGHGEVTRISPTMGNPYRYLAIRVDSGEQPLGLVRSALSLAAMSSEVRRGQQQIWLLGSGVGVAGLLVTYWLVARATRSLGSLNTAAEALASGNYQHWIPVDRASRNELDVLAQTLNKLSTRLIQREKELLHRSQTQAAILDGMLNSVIAVDREQRVLFANPAAGKTLNFQPDQVVGQPLLEVVRSHQLQEIMRQTLQTDQFTQQEFLWHGKRDYFFAGHATPLPGHPCPGVVLVLHDMTELKRLEGIRQQFISNVSHELKTPLSSIKAFTETLLDSPLEDTQLAHRFLGRIDEQANRLHELIQDMLSLARIESGQTTMETTDVSLARVIEGCVSEFEDQANAAEVTLVQQTVDPPLQVQAEEEGLQQILRNLLDNAIKYTPPGGHVTIRCQQDNDEAIIEVADTGIGIASQHHDRLFERFYRVDKARSRELGGTGLGLAIVKHLVQAMKGSVNLKSQPGKGSRFLVRLPLA
jgi:two-component system phosphate regulon sensor histidine kinase PhoR